MARYPSTVMVSVVCPWDDDEQLDEAVFRREIQHAVTAGFRRIYVFGTAGEGYAVDSARFRRVIEVFGDELAGTDATPMVGVIGLSTANVLERVAVAHAMGFREFQVSLPAWSVLSDDEVVTYLTAVCGAYPDSRFMHYNTARVGRIVDGALYRRLVELDPEPRRDQDHDRGRRRRGGRRPRGARADALPDRGNDRDGVAPRRGRAAGHVRRARPEEVVGDRSTRRTTAAIARRPRSAPGSRG